MPTMATLKVDTPTEEPTSQQKALINETQITVGLDVVNEAISTTTHFEAPPAPEITNADEQAVEESDQASDTNETEPEEVIPTSSSTHPAELPPAPPLIHQPSLPTQTTHLIPAGSVFIPRVNLQPGTYNRDMVTIPNELLSMVRGLNT